MSRVLSHQEARTFYDEFGSKQDRQGFYEDPALDTLVASAGFETSNAVVELGCGTGRLAERLLRDVLPSHATYVGFDVSETMVELAKGRLQPWAGRAQVHLTQGAPRLPLEQGCCDRFLSAYVLDLLGEEDIGEVLDEAQRLLVEDGQLCLVSLTFGETSLSRVTSRIWAAVHAVRPQLVGGCRPLRLESFLGNRWSVSHKEVQCAFSICSEVLIASSVSG